MIGNWFLRFGVLFGLAAAALGLYMHYKHDLKLSPVAVEVNMVGWVGMMIAGLFYSSISTTSEYVETVGSQIPRSAGLHFFLALIGAALVVAGSVGDTLQLTYSGTLGSMTFDAYAWGDQVTLAGAIVTGAAQLLFVFNVWRGTSH
jgi:hypothetical protein